MKVFGRTTSFNVQKVMWLLDELNMDYEHVELGGRFGGLDSEEFVRLKWIMSDFIELKGQEDF